MFSLILINSYKINANLLIKFNIKYDTLNILVVINQGINFDIILLIVSNNNIIIVKGKYIYQKVEIFGGQWQSIYDL